MAFRAVGWKICAGVVAATKATSKAHQGLVGRLTSFLKVYACTTRFRWCALCTSPDCTALLPFPLRLPALLTVVASRPVHA